MKINEKLVIKLYDELNDLDGNVRIEDFASITQLLHSKDKKQIKKQLEAYQEAFEQDFYEARQDEDISRVLVDRTEKRFYKLLDKLEKVIKI